MAVLEPENGFTIFALAGASSLAASTADGSEKALKEPSSPEIEESELDVTDRYDSAPEPPETYLLDTGEFDLDLSEMDNPDSEDWVVGATLTEDLAEISRFGSEISERESTEFDIQGLGFDTDDGEPEDAQQDMASSFDAEPAVLDEEMAIAEMEPYAPKNEIQFEPDENDFAELKEENTPNPPADSAGEISLETELDLEKKNEGNEPSQEIEKMDFLDAPVEMDSTLELEGLDLETESQEAENHPKDSSLPTSGLKLEDPDSKESEES